VTDESQIAPLPVEGFGSLSWFRDQIEAAEDKIKRYEKAWKQNIASLTNKPLSMVPAKDTVIVPIDFANVEQKKAQLYFQNPDVQLTPAPGHEAQADAIQAFTALLNETLSADGVDAETMMEEMLTDVLCPSGIGVTVIGINITQDGMKPVQVGEEPDPTQPVVDPMNPPMRPVMQDAPNIIHQEYFWDRVSPLYALIPERFTGSNFDKAPWVGYKFEMDTSLAKRTLGLSDEEAKSAGDEPQRLNDDEKPKGHDTDVVYGYVISYQGSYCNEQVVNPGEIWRLVLVKGVDRVIKHDRPYQKYAPDGRTLVGLRGHFIHIYTPRYVSDSAIPPSDVSMSRHQVDELSKGRSQMIQQRDRAKPMRQINITMVDPEQAAKIRHGEIQDVLFATTSDPIAQEIAHAQFPRENFEFNRIIKSDISETWAMGNSQRGNAEETRRTATELSIQERNSDTRLEKERKRLLKWYLRGCEKLGGLIQLFEDERETVEVIGQDNQQKLMQWDLKALPLRFVCKAKLDTMVRVDSASQFKQDLDLYQMTANDPHMNRVELLTSMVRKRGYDPAKVIQANLQPPGPKPPAMSFAFKGEDLNPAMPQFAIVQQILGMGGVQIDPQNIELGLALHQKALAQGAPIPHNGAGPVPGQAPPSAEHGGAAHQAEPLSKHANERTGKLPGDGLAQAVN